VQDQQGNGVEMLWHRAIPRTMAVAMSEEDYLPKWLMRFTLQDFRLVSFNDDSLVSWH
jgi:hypothetical protein